MSIIESTYLPFSEDELKRHFLKDADSHLDYYKKSVARYKNFLSENSELTGIPISKAKFPRQIEKDERFWTATSLKKVFDSSRKVSVFKNLFKSVFGEKPPLESLKTWDECLKGDLRLYFEVQFPAPSEYTTWLRQNLHKQQMIPYVLDAAKRNEKRPLEGPTHVDALLLNPSNGFSVFIEAKVLSDISYQITFDNFRNQMARNIDIMLNGYDINRLGEPLCRHNPDNSLFVLLTPKMFKNNPKSRLYGFLLNEYWQSPDDTLANDLKHRKNIDWSSLSKRLGWLTFEDINDRKSGACPWLKDNKSERR